MQRQRCNVMRMPLHHLRPFQRMKHRHIQIKSRFATKTEHQLVAVAAAAMASTCTFTQHIEFYCACRVQII